MFKNARHYNEENSQVYKDADTLEHLLHSRVRTLAPIDDSSKTLQRRSYTSYACTHACRHAAHTQQTCMHYSCLCCWHSPVIAGFYWSKRWWGGSGISWTICKSFAPHSRQITTPVPHHSIFYGICLWSNWCHCHPIVVFCFIKSRIVLLFWYLITQVVLGRRLLNRLLLICIDRMSAVHCSSVGRPKSKAAIALAGKLQELYNAVRDYTDSHGRTLSTPFMKMPPKSVRSYLLTS